MVLVEIPVAELRDICVRALVHGGLDADDAALVADDYIGTEAAGRISHGLAGLEVALADVKRRGTPVIVLDSPTVTVVAGNGELGHLVAAAHVPSVSRKAKDAGVAVLAVSNVSRVASPATLARAFANRGLASVCLEYGGQAFVVAPGNTQPSVSTNPIAIGFPRPDRQPLVLDIATSVRAHYFLRLAERQGEQIPSEWALDENGEGVTDPAHAHGLAPFGGYKGFGLAFMFEVLTGPMLGVAAGRRGRLDQRGLLAVVFDPETFGRNLAEIDQDVDALIADLDGAAYPGMRSGERISAMEQTGTLLVEGATLSRLRTLASS